MFVEVWDEYIVDIDQTPWSRHGGGCGQTHRCYLRVCVDVVYGTYLSTESMFVAHYNVAISQNECSA